MAGVKAQARGVPREGPRRLDVSLVIKAPPSRVLKAFFDADALGAWWQVTHSVTTPRALGAYAIEWASTEFQDDVLGRLGGVFRGTVMQFDPGRGFFVADAFWLPPDSDPIGPMALEVTCAPIESPGGVALRPPETATEVRVLQSGFEKSERWQRYYEIVSVGWQRALSSLKMLLEK
jgi:uncharacterized protein YndB with AHSA1/START domain